MKTAFKMKYKAFFITFKGLPMKTFKIDTNFFWKVRVRPYNRKIFIEKIVPGFQCYI